nr:type II toxin-antitoxin system RelE/ParE family toxin [uncultured bacterium]
MKWKIKFYKTKDGKCPVKEFIDTQPGKIAQKITWVLRLIETQEKVPRTYFKNLSGTKIYECRIEFGGNIYRILGQFYQGYFLLLTNGFQKKIQKTPKNEIELCNKRMADQIERGVKYE